MIAHLTSCIEEGLSCICFERPGVKATRLGSAEMQRFGPALYGIHRKEVCALQQLFHAQVEPPPSTATVRCQDLSISRDGPRGVTIARHVRRKGRRPQASKRLAPEIKLFNSAPGQSHSLTISAFPRSAVWDIDGID